MSVIGIVRLAPGQVGYFDDLTRIHLTIASPEKPVVSGMNTANLKRAVKSGRILLTSGSLDVATKAPAQTPVAPVVNEVKVEVQAQAPVETAEIKEESGTVTINTEAALQKIQEEKEVEVIEQAVVEEVAIEETVADTEESVVEEDEEPVVEEVVEEVKAEEATDETAKTEVKAAAKKGGTKKK